MMLRIIMMMVVMGALTACSNFVPNEKKAVYDPETKQLTMPYPCPDWSQSQTHNYLNQPHSNYGCAVNTNSALQVADPADLQRGHGDNNPDTGITTRVIERYRAGDLPVALVPQQASSSGGASQ
jgi:type IV pilus biogenesis protein CpaD/CtpE